MTYTIVVEYGPHSRPLPTSPPGGEQAHHDLEEKQAEQAMGAFLRDLFQFHGNGVSTITITANRS